MTTATLLTDSRTASSPFARSDEDLMRDLTCGQDEALAPLYGRYARLIVHMAMRHLDRAAAEEILQEVWVAVWRDASRFDAQQGSFRSWLLRLVRWKVLNELRHRRHQPQLAPVPAIDQFRAQGQVDEPLQLVADDEPGPDERALQVERDHLVQVALATLPSKQRQAVTLAFLGNLSHQEVAAALDLPLGTAKTAHPQWARAAALASRRRPCRARYRTTWQADETLTRAPP